MRTGRRRTTLIQLPVAFWAGIRGRHEPLESSGPPDIAPARLSTRHHIVSTLDHEQDAAHTKPIGSVWSSDLPIRMWLFFWNFSKQIQRTDRFYFDRNPWYRQIFFAAARTHGMARSSGRSKTPRAAGVSISTAYSHYSNKEALFVAVVEAECEQFHGTVRLCALGIGDHVSTDVAAAMTCLASIGQRAA